MKWSRRKDPAMYSQERGKPRQIEVPIYRNKVDLEIHADFKNRVALLTFPYNVIRRIKLQPYTPS